MTFLAIIFFNILRFDLQMCNSLSVHLKKLFDVSDDLFWRSGWIYARVQNQIAFVNKGILIFVVSF